MLKRGAKSRIGEHECVYRVYVGCRHGQHICQPSCDDRRPLRDGLIRDSRRRRRVRNDNGDTCNSIYYNSLRTLDMFCRGQAAGPLGGETATNAAIRLDLCLIYWLMSVTLVMGHRTHFGIQHLLNTWYLLLHVLQWHIKMSFLFRVNLKGTIKRTEYNINSSYSSPDWGFTSWGSASEVNRTASVQTMTYPCYIPFAGWTWNCSNFVTEQHCQQDCSKCIIFQLYLKLPKWATSLP